MQLYHGRSSASTDVSFFLENAENFLSGSIEKRRKPTKFKRDRNFPSRHKSSPRSPRP